MPSFAAGIDDAGVVRLGHDGLLLDRADDIRERLALRTLAHDARLRRVAGPVMWLLDLGIFGRFTGAPLPPPAMDTLF
jgi:hypothetical protein